MKCTVRHCAGSTNAFTIFSKILDLCWTKIVLLSLSPKAESFVGKQTVNILFDLFCFRCNRALFF